MLHSVSEALVNRSTLEDNLRDLKEATWTCRGHSLCVMPVRIAEQTWGNYTEGSWECSKIGLEGGQFSLTLSVRNSRDWESALCKWASIILRLDRGINVLYIEKGKLYLFICLFIYLFIYSFSLWTRAWFFMSNEIMWWPLGSQYEVTKINLWE